MNLRSAILLLLALVASGCGGGEKREAKKAEARSEKLVAELKKLTKDYSYASFEDDFYQDEVTDIVLDPAAGTLLITTTDFEMADRVIAAIPLQSVAILTGGPEEGVISAVKFACDDGAQCIGFENVFGLTPQSRKSVGDSFSFGCEKSRCRKIADALQELTVLAKSGPGGASQSRLQAALLARVQGVEEWIVGAEFNADSNILWLALQDNDLRAIDDAWEHTIPLSKARVTRREGGLALACISEPCIVRYQGDGDYEGGKHGGDEIDATISEVAFACAPKNCDVINKEISTLIAEARTPAESGPIASTGNAVTDALNSLLKEITYTADVKSDDGAAKGLMTMEIAFKTMPRVDGNVVIESSGTYGVAWEDGGHQLGLIGSTATVPVADVTVSLDRTKRGELQPAGASAYREPVHSVILACDGGLSCIATESEDGAERTARYSVACRESICQAVVSDFRTLIDAAKKSATPRQSRPQQATPPGFSSQTPVTAEKPISRVLAKAVNQANSRVDRNAPPLPGLLPTQGLAILGDGRIALHTDSCASDRKGCGAGAITENEIVVAFSPAHINGSSVAMQGNAVIFACRPDAGACIRSPDGRLQFAGYGIPCRDQTECNRLVLDFSSLIAVAAQ